jgi:hypothetical protein
VVPYPCETSPGIRAVPTARVAVAVACRAAAVAIGTDPRPAAVHGRGTRARHVGRRVRHVELSD